MAHATTHHDHAGLMCRTIGRHGNQTTGHHRGYRRLQVAILDPDPANHVEQSHDSQRHTTVCIDHDDRIDSHSVEQQQGLTDAHRWPDGELLRTHQMTQGNVRREGGNAFRLLST
ncbi:MAG: hypothetical protein AW06_004319 [Candidatus Accumulibacter cognatus]|uniref:Uncharacterized protein n=1 Tax=Candidatus Accumulibacter cognatus TaxID=2954383 RepID=A0A080MC52_9PROT|nr:MAG: hypothetical protein AW06_004319 [Candidatus Accumulibacter cognatus]